MKLCESLRKTGENPVRTYLKQKKPSDRSLQNTILRNFTTISVLTGGTVYVISKNHVLCKAKTTRMVGYESSLDKKLKFDWNQLWHYLKPYIGYFLAAVVVSK